MEFEQAKQLKKLNEHLIGKVYDGALIDDLILRPNNPTLMDSFDQLYLLSEDGESSIVPFIGSDVDIFIVCKKNLIKRGLFLYTSIFNLPTELDVITEL